MQNETTCSTYGFAGVIIVNKVGTATFRAFFGCASFYFSFFHGLFSSMEYCGEKTVTVGGSSWEPSG
jgi:hypothetical protein